MEGVKAIWDFPTDKFRPAVPSGTSERAHISLKKSTVQAMKNLSTQVRIFLYLVLSPNRLTLLGRCCGKAVKREPMAQKAAAKRKE